MLLSRDHFPIPCHEISESLYTVIEALIESRSLAAVQAPGLP